MSSLAHEAHIALNEPMTSIGTWAHVWVHVQLGSSAHLVQCERMISVDQQGLSLGSSLAFPSLNSYNNLTLCQVLSSGRQRQIWP